MSQTPRGACGQTGRWCRALPVLRRFSTPGRVPDRKPAAWSGAVKELISAFDSNFQQFYDPSAANTPEGIDPTPVVWSAFPASLRAAPGKRLETADGGRRHMDEYCEWGVERNRTGKITRVTFTTEVPEYYEHLFRHDRERLLEIYQTLVNPKVKAADLERNGRYVRANGWNKSTVGRPAHLIQSSNSLRAAVQLAAEATILRQDGGQVVNTKQRLVECGGLGNPFRNSDPQIALAVNNAARSGTEVSLADPVGLYIEGLITGGMTTPDGASPASFWKIERGRRGHAVRASYEVPKDRKYVVGDIKSGGQPIKWGGEIAQRVRIRIDALVKPASHRPKPQPCVG
jgi:hypothetical protein